MGIEATQEEIAAAQGYEALFVSALFGPWTGHLIKGLAPEAGSRVLDVACGTGVLTRDVLTSRPGLGRVVGLDPAPGMLVVAQALEPRADWVLGSAEALPFDDGAFDCLGCQFGMMFIEHRLKAASEMLRVLRPGGRLAIAVWNNIAENPAHRDVAVLFDALVGEAAGDAVRVPFCLGDRNECVALFTETGFCDLKVRTLTERARFPDTRTLVEADLRGWLPLFGIRLNEEEIARILAASDERLASYKTGSGAAEFDVSAHIFTARRPD